MPKLRNAVETKESRSPGAPKFAKQTQLTPYDVGGSLLVFSLATRRAAVGISSFGQLALLNVSVCISLLAGLQGNCRPFTPYFLVSSACHPLPLLSQASHTLRQYGHDPPPFCFCAFHCNITPDSVDLGGCAVFFFGLFHPLWNCSPVCDAIAAASTREMLLVSPVPPYPRVPIRRIVSVPCHDVLHICTTVHC